MALAVMLEAAVSAVGLSAETNGSHSYLKDK